MAGRKKTSSDETTPAEAPKAAAEPKPSTTSTSKPSSKPSSKTYVVEKGKSFTSRTGLKREGDSVEPRELGDGAYGEELCEQLCTKGVLKRA